MQKPVAIALGESGKRTLSGEVDKAVTARRRKTAEAVRAAENVFDANSRSRFFGATFEHNSTTVTPELDSVQQEPVITPWPHKVTETDGEETPVVEQEAGYRSPSFSTAPFVSSPIKPTEDESQSSILETQITTPAATGLRATLTLGVPETPITSHNSLETVADQPTYQLSIDLEQIFSQGCEDAGVEETQLVSQGSSRAGSSFDHLDHSFNTSGHTTDTAEKEDYGVSESEYGVPESDVEGVVPQEPSIELVEAAEKSIDDQMKAHTEVIARGWRTRFTLAAMAGRSAPGEEKMVNLCFSRVVTLLTGGSLRRPLISDVERPTSPLLPLVDVEHQRKPHSKVSTSTSLHNRSLNIPSRPE